MKLIIAGSRDLSEEVIYAELVQLKLNDHPMASATVIGSGRCRGPDLAGEAYADFYGIPVKSFPADWEKYGKAAGPIRNEEMVKWADGALVFIKPGGSKGSSNLIKNLKTLGKPIWVYTIY